MIAGITPTQLILEASLPVQLVLLTLLGLSIVSWVMIFQRALVLSAAAKGVLSFENRFWSGMDLSQLYKEGSQMQKEDIPLVGMESIFRAGFKEFMRLRQQVRLRLLRSCYQECLQLSYHGAERRYAVTARP